jgi:ABC-type oligopeptide transport system substrate-binding subunit
MTRGVALAFATLLTGAALLVAAELAASASPKGGTVRILSPGEIDSVDPALAYFTDAWELEYATCAKLFNYPDAAGTEGRTPTPEVVHHYTLSADRRTYTFELKKTFRFHTGAPVTAQSFADAINRDADPQLDSPAKAYLHDIAGADAVIEGKAETVTGVRVLGRHRLRISLTQPAGDVLARLAMPFFCPILPNTPPAEIVDPAGSGPYYIAERVLNQRTVLRRNPYYRGNRPANVDEIVRTPGVGLAACVEAVEADRADLCGEIGAPRTAYQGLAEKYGLNRAGGRLFVRPSLATWFIVFNNERPAFKGTGQIALKKAINYAIDRPELVRAFGYLAGRRADQMLPPGLARPGGTYTLSGASPAAAQRWYGRARVKPTKLVLYAWALPSFVIAAQALAYNLRQLGIDLEVKYFAPETVVAKTRTPGEPVDLYLASWQADYADGAAYFQPLLDPRSPVSVGNVADVALRRRIAAVSRLAGEARARAWAELDFELMRDNPPWAPFMHLNARAFVSPSLACFVEHPLFRVDLVAVCKK